MHGNRAGLLIDPLIDPLIGPLFGLVNDPVGAGAPCRRPPAAEPCR